MSCDRINYATVASGECQVLNRMMLLLEIPLNKKNKVFVMLLVVITKAV